MNDIEKKMEALKVEFKKLEALKAKFLGKLEALQKEAEMQKKQEELKPWKPEVGEKYFVAVEDGADVVQYCEDSIDEFNIRFGNCFRTKERAEQVARKMRLLLRLEQLHDMLCPDYEPDWNDHDTPKIAVHFDCEKDRMVSTCTYSEKSVYEVYFDSFETADKVAAILNREVVK